MLIAGVLAGGRDGKEASRFSDARSRAYQKIVDVGKLKMDFGRTVYRKIREIWKQTGEWGNSIFGVKNRAIINGVTRRKSWVNIQGTFVDLVARFLSWLWVQVDHKNNDSERLALFCSSSHGFGQLLLIRLVQPCDPS